jgi:hypothetical protein
MSRQEKIMRGLLIALQTSVITLALVFVLYHSTQYIGLWLAAFTRIFTLGGLL